MYVGAVIDRSSDIFSAFVLHFNNLVEYLMHRAFGASFILMLHTIIESSLYDFVIQRELSLDTNKL
jgi:hypothetical protein